MKLPIVDAAAASGSTRVSAYCTRGICQQFDRLISLSHSRLEGIQQSKCGYTQFPGFAPLLAFSRTRKNGWGFFPPHLGTSPSRGEGGRILVPVGGRGEEFCVLLLEDKDMAGSIGRRHPVQRRLDLAFRDALAVRAG